MKQSNIAIQNTFSNTHVESPESIGRNAFFKSRIQPKLSINQPNDIYEQEADAMADKVMRTSDKQVHQQTFFKPAIASVQRKCQHCEEEEKQLHRKEMNNDVAVADVSTENYISSLNGKGRTLTPAERGFFEPRIGYDFSQVQLHTNSEANQSAKAINALAYTHSNHIVFGSNQYQPNTESGQRLMAHELTHVVQQQKNVSPKLVQRDTPKTTAVNQSVTETISNAPIAGYNKTISWSSKFDLMLDPTSKHLIIVMRLFTSAADNLKTGWKNIIEDRWGKGKFAIEAWNTCPPIVYPIDVNIQWISDESKAHYVIKPSNPGDTQDGRAGTGGTTGMTHWGTADSSDVPHEFGHMLGNIEEYFTTNGIDYTYGGTKKGYRDRGGGIMNNPSEAPFPKHYELVKSTFIGMMNLPSDKIRVVDQGILNPPMIKCDNPGSLPSNVG